MAYHHDINNMDAKTVLKELIEELEADIILTKNDIKYSFTQDDSSYYQAQLNQLENLKDKIVKRLKKL
jgi:galactitol-specific phosphotransferase system IIB component